ncbi:ribosome small subunit-dependent GTPase A [Mycoplasmopsis glycophila]|uniref:Small ribosomal subunit biogenesis GTPase RsgA n=1 Tax=Mycoplasmopsis glycophila TaxID=171285 RepID=A0A449AUT7_9BACT|nr:ribosome small subunit-dependent GTPase A [Mycoplasmopsis glycophila]VEU70277.1 putative GTPase engC [Mycoplasmopsis glycophila]
MKNNQYKVFSIVAGMYKLVNNQEEITIPAAGKLRYLEIHPIVGDEVIVSEGKIVEVLERRNSFIRPKVANVDQMFVFMSIKEPEFQPYLVDKYLAIIEQKQIKPILCFTKIDLDLENSKKWSEYYQNMGYEVFLIDNTNFDSNVIDKIKKSLVQKYSVFMGQSGVGKTTTLNSLGNYNYETQAISKALGRGKHTTRVVTIIPFNSGYLIDTPGFSSLDLDLSKIELAQSYRTFATYSKMCKFRSCLHSNEPIEWCYVKQNVGKSSIPLIRYENYLKLLSEIK